MSCTRLRPLVLLAALPLVGGACTDRPAPPPEPPAAAEAPAAPAAPPAPEAAAYACAGGETITLAGADTDTLRYVLDGRAVTLYRVGADRFATEAMAVTFEADGRVSVMRDEQASLDCAPADRP